MEVDHVPIDVMDAKKYAREGDLRGHPEAGGGTGGMTAENMHMYSQYQNFHRQGDYFGGGTMTGQKHFHSQNKFGAFDGIALSQDFLGEYYISVSTHLIS